jgi:hypothetical protein
MRVFDEELFEEEEMKELLRNLKELVKVGRIKIIFLLPLKVLEKPFLLLLKPLIL